MNPKNGIESVSRLALGKVLFWLFIFLISLGVGYAIGSSWAVSLSPQPWYDATGVGTSMITPAPVPTMAPVTPSVTSAQPPLLNMTILSVTLAPMSTTTSVPVKP